MNFGQAQEAMDVGKKVARKGWNGKGLWACKVPTNDWDIPSRFGKFVELRAFYGLKDVQGHFGPWVPSTSDLLANDWEVVE